MFDEQTRNDLLIVYLRDVAQDLKEVGSVELRGRYTFLQNTTSTSDVTQSLKMIAEKEPFLTPVPGRDTFLLNKSDKDFGSRAQTCRTAALTRLDGYLKAISECLPLSYFTDKQSRDPVRTMLTDRFPDLKKHAAAMLKIRKTPGRETVETYLKNQCEAFGLTVEDFRDNPDLPNPVTVCRVKLPGVIIPFEIILYTISAEAQLEQCGLAARFEAQKHVAVLYLGDNRLPLEVFHIAGRRIVRLPASLMLTVAASHNAKQTFGEKLLEQADLELLSPYDSQGKTRDQMFYGRVTELERLRHRRDTSFAVYGPRRIGKTSIVYQVKQLAEEENPAQELPGYVDCSGIENVQDAIEELTDIFGFDWKPGKSSTAFVSSVRRARKERIPNGRFLLIMDEVDRLIMNANAHEEFFWVLRKLINQELFRIIVCGYRHLRRASEQLDNPLYNMFSFERLGNMDDFSARELIRKPMLSLGVKVHDSTVGKIIGRTSTHPGTIQFFCHEILKLLNESSERIVTDKHVSQVERSERLETYVLSGLRTSLDETDKQLIRGHSIQSAAPLKVIVENCKGVLTKIEVEESVARLVDHMIMLETPAGFQFAQPLVPILVNRGAEL